MGARSNTHRIDGVCSLVGFCDRAAAVGIKPLREAPRLNVLITAIGVSLLLQNGGRQLNAVFGPSPKKLPALLPMGN